MTVRRSPVTVQLVESDGDTVTVDIEMAAHGVTVVEIARDGEDWRIVLDSPHNRRISPLTAMSADGPAAGDKRLQTSGDPSGKSLVDTLNNCAGGVTPWNTYLTAEENFHFYFWTDQRGADIGVLGVRRGCQERRDEKEKDQSQSHGQVARAMRQVVLLEGGCVRF